jgi:hypothetical protein
MNNRSIDTDRVGVGGAVPTLLFQDKQPELRHIFRVLGYEEFPENLDEAVNITQPWAMGDHSRPGYEHGELTEYKKTELHEIFTKLGMVKEQILGGEFVDDLVFCAAIFAGALRRAELLKRMVCDEGLKPNRIFILSGERRPYPEVEADDFYRTMEEVKLKKIDDPWIECIDVDNMKLEDFWETDMMRLAALRHLGEMSLIRTILRDEIDEHGAPKLQYMEFDWRGIPLVMHHSLAVPRPMGLPRSTTENSIKEYADVHQPMLNSRTVLLSAQPHMQRMALSAERTLTSVGRGDIAVLPAASRVGNIKEPMYLGEIARWLWEEREWIRA